MKDNFFGELESIEEVSEKTDGLLYRLENKSKLDRNLSYCEKMNYMIQIGPEELYEICGLTYVL